MDEDLPQHVCLAYGETTHVVSLRSAGLSVAAM